jgi:hypothetical protein
MDNLVEAEKKDLLDNLFKLGFDFCECLPSEDKWNYSVAYATKIFAKKPIFTGFCSTDLAPVVVCAEANAEWAVDFDEDLLQTDRELVDKYKKRKPEVLNIKITKKVHLKVWQKPFETKRLIILI